MAQYAPQPTTSDGHPDVVQSSKRTRSGDHGSAKEFQAGRIRQEAEMSAAENEAAGVSAMEGMVQTVQELGRRLQEKDTALGEMWEQLATTKEQLDRANTMLISAQSSVDELTSSASCKR
jgi:hypothetical protein